MNEKDIKAALERLAAEREKTKARIEEIMGTVSAMTDKNVTHVAMDALNVADRIFGIYPVLSLLSPEARTVFGPLLDRAVSETVGVIMSYGLLVDLDKSSADTAELTLRTKHASMAASLVLAAMQELARSHAQSVIVGPKPKS